LLIKTHVEGTQTLLPVMSHIKLLESIKALKSHIHHYQWPPTKQKTQANYQSRQNMTLEKAKRYSRTPAFISYYKPNEAVQHQGWGNHFFSLE
jgi:hypothetical protein